MTIRAQQWTCLAASLAIHAAALFGVGRSPWVGVPERPATLSVQLLAPPVQELQAPATPIEAQPTPQQRTSQRAAPRAPRQQAIPRAPTAKTPASLERLTPNPPTQPIQTQNDAAQSVAAAPAPPAPQPASVPTNTVTTAATAPFVPAAPDASSLAPQTTTEGASALASPQGVTAAHVANLTTDLALACPNQPAATYPMLSRRLNESGTVLLRVELDERGAVAHVNVERSSGFPRLDAAALATVRTWHCRAPTRNGEPARATALQPIRFKLED